MPDIIKESGVHYQTPDARQLKAKNLILSMMILFAWGIFLCVIFLFFLIELDFFFLSVLDVITTIVFPVIISLSFFLLHKLWVDLVGTHNFIVSITLYDSFFCGYNSYRKLICECNYDKIKEIRVKKYVHGIKLICIKSLSDTFFIRLSMNKLGECIETIVSHSRNITKYDCGYLQERLIWLRDHNATDGVETWIKIAKLKKKHRNI